MLPSRFTTGPGQSSAMRKSRLEGKPSLLPKPRRPGSTDRLSTETRWPSTAGHRSSSAEPRSTFGGRLSREASATKLPLNRRSRSQQGDKFGQSSITPLRSNQYSIRPTTTPVRTPSVDRAGSNWQTSLDRVLAFVTIKDQRPISNVAWQRAEAARVGAALAARGGGGGGGALALIRPLTIARFVNIVGGLLSAILRDAKLNNDNYVTKLPHLSKRLLYPGSVAKSWLKTVNTLHAFPHALALIGYLLDLVNHIEMPVLDDWMYLHKDELACLRRDLLYKCWIVFQGPNYQFEDLNNEYLQNLKVLLGNDEEKIEELKQVIKKYEACLEDAAEVSARAAETQRAARRDVLAETLRAARAGRAATRADIDAQAARRADDRERARRLDLELERANAENQQLKVELEQQSMSVAERSRLLDEVDYSTRVRDSKRALADQVAKMVLSKETELALWQKKTLDSCVEYNQGLIRLSAQLPRLAALAIDEKELMGAECASSVCQAVAALRECSAALAERRAEHARSKTALARKRDALLEETRTKITEMKISIARSQQAIDAEMALESNEAAAWEEAMRSCRLRMEQLQHQAAEYRKVDQELDYWEKQDQAWRSKLISMREYIESQRELSQHLLRAARDKRLNYTLDRITLIKEKLAMN